MIDLSKVDLDKCPELPGGLFLRHEKETNSLCIVVGERRDDVLVGGLCRAKLRPKIGSGWTVFYQNADEALDTLEAIKIVDAFIAEQLAEQQKPQPKRLTPKEAFAELRKTGAQLWVRGEWDGVPMKLSRVRFRDTIELEAECDDGWRKYWYKFPIQYFMSWSWVEIVYAPEEVKIAPSTKAPEPSNTTRYCQPNAEITPDEAVTRRCMEKFYWWMTYDGAVNQCSGYSRESVTNGPN